MPASEARRAAVARLYEEATGAAESLLTAHARQYALETAALEANIEQYKKIVASVIAVGKGAALPVSQRLVVSWFTPMAEAVDREQALIWARAQGTDRATYGPYLVLLPPEKLAVITMHEVMSMVLGAAGSVPFTSLAARVGQAVQAEVNMMKLRYRDRRAWSRLAAGRTANIATMRRQARRALEEADWPPRTHVKVGGALIHLLLQVARVEVQPDGRLVFERDDAAAAATPLSQRARELQSYFLHDNHPYFPASKGRDAAALAARDRRVDERVRAAAEEGLVPWHVAEIASLPPSSSGGGGGSGSGSAGGDDGATPGGGGGEVQRVWDAVGGREVVTVPAFRHMYARPTAGRVTGMVAVHPRLLELLTGGMLAYAHPTHFPMVVPPRPWTGPGAGGYLRQRVPILRLTPGARIQMDVLRTATCPAVYDALTALGATPWRINTGVLDVVQRVWENGGGVAEVPSRADLALPPAPTPEALAAAGSEEERTALARRARLQLRHAMQANADLHSLRCDMTLKLGVAEQFRRDVIYFPHNLDFRGRVYPVPPHLNHMGSDVCRGLLTFAAAKPLGTAGLRWLKIHVANLMGKDKISLDDREAFTEAHLRDVADAADRPLLGNGWWLGADAPWQALAACRELTAALRTADPTSYECALPVHQDGSCNGLQHYAALGRDASGGAAVNLTPSAEDKPQDVYSQVLRLVQARMAADAAGVPLPPSPGAAATAVPAAAPDAHVYPSLSAAYTALQATTPADLDARVGINASVRRLAAQFLLGSVDRKVVKQTVMTSVYGVTFIGARQQILNRLKEKFATSPLPVDELENTLFLAASYLARTTLDSLGDLFNAADAIKGWLAEVARLVAHAEQPMSWITPLGLPVVQPYRRERSMMVKTILQDVVIADSSESMPVSAARQRSAFPPNFVHSLDSTHMMMTALDMRARGLTFAAVHDSYWTHAGDVDVMSASLRDQFVSLYSLPLLENFRASLVQRFPGIAMPDLPPRGSLHLADVRKSRYFFN